MQAARQLLLSLFDGALAGGGQGGRRGNGSNNRGGSRQGPGARPREGEWPCVCGFGTNRPYRGACFACGRPRDAAEVNGAAAAKGNAGRWMADNAGQKSGRPCTTNEGYQQGKGPVGAGGSRPLLGWGGRGPLGGPAGGGHCKGTATVPNWSGKGPPSVTTGGKDGNRAKAGHGDVGKGASKGGAGDGGKTAPVGGDVGKGGSWVRPPAVYDDDGYELVQPRKVRATGDQQGDCTTATKGASDGGTMAGTTRRRWSDDEDSDDGDMRDEGDEADGDAWDAGDEHEWAVDPKQLRTTFEEHAKVVREMERRGNHGPALETLRAARDEAERRWRETKPPAPLPKRLEWAEAKLRKSQAALTRLRLQLDAFDEETDRKRAELCGRIQEAQEWYNWRQQQLDSVHAEAADRAPGRRGGASEADRTVELRKQIRSRTLPEMQAILEEVQEGTELHGRLALLVAGLADAEARTGEQQEGEGPTQYNLYDGDSMHGMQGEGDHDEDDSGGAHGDARAGDGKGGRPTGWRPEGPGRWTRTGRGRDTDADGGSKGGSGKGAHSAGGDATPPTSADSGDGTRAGKSRRLCSDEEAKEDERAESDARRARELQRQLEQATAAQQQSYNEGRGGFGSEAALSVAAQRFVLDVQRAQAQAGEMGVEPRASDGRTLLELSPSELRQWVGDNLDADEMQD